MILNCKTEVDCKYYKRLIDSGDKKLRVAEQDQRSIGLPFRVTDMHFAHCLKKGEDKICGHLKLQRLKEEQPDSIRLGGPHLQALWEDYRRNGPDSGLQWLWLERRIGYIDFPGLVLQIDQQEVWPCLFRDKDQFSVTWMPLTGGFSRQSPAALLH